MYNGLPKTEQTSDKFVGSRDFSEIDDPYTLQALSDSLGVNDDKVGRPAAEVLRVGRWEENVDH